MYRILVKEDLVPNVHLFKIEAPNVAKKAQAGQFVVIRIDERGERIPLTVADWDEKVPGFFEVDLVSHDGGAVREDFAQSLNFTDIATGWVEMIAVKNKAQV